MFLIEKKQLFSPKKGPIILFILAALQIGLGGLVAGYKAGHIYNTFPLMAGQWLPPELTAPVIFQWLHRVGGIAFLIAVVWYYLATLHDAHKNKLIPILVGLTLGQVVLGIATLLLNVPVVLGVGHQLVAVGILICLFRMMHRAKGESG